MRLGAPKNAKNDKERPWEGDRRERRHGGGSAARGQEEGRRERRTRGRRHPTGRGQEKQDGGIRQAMEGFRVEGGHRREIE